MEKNLNRPALSVVLPVYNGQATVADAIQSVLDQSFTDFELVVINDGSTDKTADILSGYNDPRLRVASQKNQGIVAALNKGISLAKAPLIARHDADDRSLPKRFAKQLELFKTNTNLVLAGTSMQVMNTAGKYLHDHMVLLDNPELKQELLVRSPFAHGSVIFKKAAFEKAGGYKQSEWPAEDYGLWLRMAPFGEFANLDEPLYVYRENTAGISMSNNARQTERTERLRRKAWAGRNRLVPAKIHTKPYLALKMGHFRLERIAKNLMFCLATAIKNGEVATAVRSLRPIFNNSLLRRKCARLVLISLKVKDA